MDRAYGALLYESPRAPRAVLSRVRAYAGDRQVRLRADFAGMDLRRHAVRARLRLHRLQPRAVALRRVPDRGSDAGCDVDPVRGAKSQRRMTSTKAARTSAAPTIMLTVTVSPSSSHPQKIPRTGTARPTVRVRVGPMSRTRVKKGR